MANRVKDIELSATFSIENGMVFRNGKIFLGVLGFEYPFGGLEDVATGGNITKDISNFDASGKPSASLLEYVYINRTANQEDYAFSDGILPVYLRFQPDLVEPLTLAAQNDTTAGVNYGLQAVHVDNPVVKITGPVASKDAAGVTKYFDQTVTFCASQFIRNRNEG